MIQEGLLKIGIPKETAEGETRVAITPATIRTLQRRNHEVFVEGGAGAASSIRDADFRDAGATVVAEAAALYDAAGVVFKVRPPGKHSSGAGSEAEMIRDGSVFIGFLEPAGRPGVIRWFRDRHITSFAMEYIPRIARAQSMDALSSMATVAGYKAVLLAADRLPKMFPLMMTAAGTIPPASVLVLGAGVAGLQAIATAKRLGAKVEAFDPRPAVREQIQSLGAAFVEMELPKDVETAGGYAKEQSDDFLKREMDAISARLPHSDVVITTAQVFGKRAPVLVTSDMLKLLRPGAVLVDLAAEQGGNCEETVAGKTVERHGITIIGATNLPAALPADASRMYAKNVVDLFLLLFPEGAETPDMDDEIARGCCITHDGDIVNEAVRNLLSQKGEAK